MLTKTRALAIIDILLKKTKPRSYYVKRESFQIATYEHWALCEIAAEITNRENISPMEILEQFRSKVDRYCCDAKTDTQRIIFATAYDVATDLLDYFIEEGGIV